MKIKMKFEEIDKLAIKLAQLLESGDIICLIGDLGTGKTTFVKKFAKSLGVKENIKSPTYNYVLEYLSGKFPLYHFDVYRLSESSEIYELGYEEYINGEGIIIIEWANLIEEELPNEYIKMELFYSDEEESRMVDIQYVGNAQKEKEMLNYVGLRD